MNLGKGTSIILECEYLYKFCLLYRVIILEQIGVDYSYVKDYLTRQISAFNNTYPIGRIRP